MDRRPRASVTGARGGPGAVRQGDYKLIEFFEDDRIELYDLECDLGEENNLADAMPDTVQALHRALERWCERQSARMPEHREAGRD